MGVITAIRRFFGMTAIEGYRFIVRDSPNHEPRIQGTNAPISWVARELELGTTVEQLIKHYRGRMIKEMLDEAVRYIKEHPDEIRGYITESIKKSGTSFKTR